MKKLGWLMVGMLSGTAIAGEETCYELSKDGLTYNKDVLCMMADETMENRFIFTLKSQDQEVASFKYNLMPSKTAIKANKNSSQFGFDKQTEGPFKKFMIKFFGNKNPANGDEAGELRVMGGRYFYRKLNPPASNLSAP